MSRRRPERRSPPEPAPPARRPDDSPGLLAQIAILVAVVAIVTVIAELAGAANLGVALSVGTIAFTIVLMYLILKP
jgi:hypothetical protein